jgi:peptidyl-prolyl cis-trans isomerase SurA
MTSMYQLAISGRLSRANFMSFRFLRIPAAFALAALASFGVAQTAPAAANGAYGGTTVEDIIARVNDQIISQSDYDRAMSELDSEGREHGASMQEISAQHKDLLRNMIDQQLWLSKGKELGITGDTELIKRLDEIRKQSNLATLEDLENAAKEQGVSFEDF